MEYLNAKEAYQLTGKSREAELLRLLSFWQTLAKTKWDGKIWMIKTADELIEEGMNCSKTTIYRTLTKLEKKGFIELVHRPHRYKKALHASWVRVIIPPDFVISPK